MKALEIITEYHSRSDEFTLYPLTDIHWGGAACDESRFTRTLDAIAADPNARYWLGGDMCEFIDYRDSKRFDVRTLSAWLVRAWHDTGDLAYAQRENLLAQFAERDLLGKCVGITRGNHEEAIFHHLGIDSYQPIVEKHHRATGKLLALGFCGFIVWRFIRVTGDGTKGNTFTVTIWTHHGWGGGELMGGIALKLEREMPKFEADLFLMGHHHAILTHVKSRGMKVNEALHIEQLPDAQGAVCGSFLRARIEDIETYGEQRSDRATPTSDVCIRIRPDKREFEIASRTKR